MGCGASTAQQIAVEPKQPETENSVSDPPPERVLQVENSAIDPSSNPAEATTEASSSTDEKKSVTNSVEESSEKNQDEEEVSTADNHLESKVEKEQSNVEESVACSTTSTLTPSATQPETSAELETSAEKESTSIETMVSAQRVVRIGSRGIGKAASAFVAPAARQVRASLSAVSPIFNRAVFPRNWKPDLEKAGIEERMPHTEQARPNSFWEFQRGRRVLPRLRSVREEADEVRDKDTSEQGSSDLAKLGGRAWTPMASQPETPFAASLLEGIEGSLLGAVKDRVTPRSVSPEQEHGLPEASDEIAEAQDRLRQKIALRSGQSNVPSLAGEIVAGALVTGVENHNARTRATVGEGKEDEANQEAERETINNTEDKNVPAIEEEEGRVRSGTEAAVGMRERDLSPGVA